MGKGRNQNQVRDQQKNEFEKKRLRDRLLGFIQYQIKDSNEILQSAEISGHLRQTHGEYQRRDISIFQRQVQSIMDEIFAEVNLTNIHKSFYKKKDLVKIKENSDAEQNNPEHKTVDSNDENAGIDLTQEPEKPKNSMNELIL